MKLTVDGVPVIVDGLESDELNAIHTRLAELLAQSPRTVKSRDAIASAFTFGIGRCPEVNPSDLWHHVIYREYIRMITQVRGVNDPKQSWVRASGDAFELFLQDYYNQRLAADGVRLVALFSKSDSKPALEEMGIDKEVGGSKLDLAIRRADGAIIGGIHAKVSLAERISDDVPASAAMMRRGYLSAIATLDAKSFPRSRAVSEERAYQNRGELGTPTAPSDKRKYIEEHGSFDLCVSYNLRTVPSAGATPSGKRIFRVKLGSASDPLEQAIRQRI